MGCLNRSKFMSDLSVLLLKNANMNQELMKESNWRPGERSATTDAAVAAYDEAATAFIKNWAPTEDDNG